MEANEIKLMRAEDYLKSIENECIDLTITSPPYDKIRDYDKGNVFCIDTVTTELFRTTKNGGVVVWVVGDQTKGGSESGTSFRQALKFMDAGFFLHDTMIYKKDSISFPERNRYSQIFEYMFVFSKGQPKTVNILKDRKNKWHGTKLIKGRERQADGTLIDKRKGNLLKEYGSRYNIWEYSTGMNKSTKDKIAFNHPAIFPEKLAADHIHSWSNEGDIVCDIFSGSATVAKMAIISNRKYIGCELSKEYFDLGNIRIEPYKTQNRMVL